MAVPLNPRQAASEADVLARWRERDVAGEARRRRDGAPARVIWTGQGESARVLADVFARYATMRGWQVDLRFCGGCHDPAVERMGVAPGAGAHRPSDAEYIESVWWAMREIAERGLLYEDMKVVAYCPCCRSPVCDDAITLADVEHPAAYIRFKVARDGGPLQAGDELLVFTAAPWTLVANAAVAVDPELTYIRAKTGTLDAPVVVAEALVEKVLGHGAEVRILDRFRGAAIDGVRYEPPFGYLAAGAFGERGHSVLLAGFVTTTEGTGVAAMATGFSEDDRELGARHGLAVVNPVDADGRFDERAGRYAGRPVQDAATGLIDDLRTRGRLLRAVTGRGAAPHCGTCDTRLIPRATRAWYVATARLDDVLRRAANGARVGIRPGSTTDRLVSRAGARGTPLPVWRCEHGHVTVIGSFDELEQRSGARLADAHRPWVDDVALECACGRPATRVADLVQPWFEAGAMPFAQRHEPFAGDQTLDELYPADLVCAAGDELAALLIVSALLRGGEPVCEHVVRPRPAGAVDGADAQRWHIATGDDGDDELLRRVWSAYAVAVSCELDGAGAEEPGELDRWIASRLSAAIERAGKRLDGYDAAGAARAIATFADDLCGWYVPRASERLQAGDPAARTALRECLLSLARLLAPFVPFLADEVYLGLGGSEPSVHLCDWPVAGARDLDLETAVALTRDA